VFNSTQENLTQGGLRGRSTNGRRQQTRPVQGIDQNIPLNRALWLLADNMLAGVNYLGRSASIILAGEASCY
jgi:hypothetical protein